MAAITTFEELPNEMILIICGYLRGNDVLYSFFDLNTRLNQIIASRRLDIDLLAPAYTPFHHVVSHVLPQIGTSVRSFALNGHWRTVLSANTLTVLFGPQLSILFPSLEKLTLKWFTAENMSLLLPSLENFSKLVALDIHSLHGRNDDGLLTRILGANNGRLESVTFDEYCDSLTIPDNGGLVSYPKIEELTVNIKGNQSLQCLFRILPHVRRLHVKVEDHDTDDANFSKVFATLPPLHDLINFQLQSRLDLWTSDEIASILRLMPSLKKLTLSLRTDDERLIKVENLIAILPSPATEIHVAIRYSFPTLNFNTNQVHAWWPKPHEISCLLEKKRQRILFHTNPYELRSVALPAELSKQMPTGSGWNWEHMSTESRWNWEQMKKVEDLSVFEVKSLDQIFLMVQHFHHLKRLTISILNKSIPCAETLPEPSVLLTLPRLRHLTVSGICPLLHIVQAAPNLDHLDITLDCLRNLIDDEQVCVLLQQRIVRLEIREWLNTEIHLLPRIAQMFCNLQQLEIQFADSSMIMDLTVKEVLANWHEKRLYWLLVRGSLSDQAKENLRQWLIEHTHLLTNDPFAVDYTDPYLTLWK